MLGPDTAAALRAYQRDRRLDVTGQLDAQTTRALQNETSTAVAPRAPEPAADIRTAQQHLTGRGYYSGPIDGVLGPATENAIRAFQRDRGLKATGRLDPVTMRTLSA